MFKIDKNTHPFPDIRLQAKVGIVFIDESINSILQHPLYEYLSQLAKIGFTPMQFCVQSRGYLEACKQVIPLFEKVLVHTKEQGDHITEEIIQENLNEEYGISKDGV
jgi:hypothetical protein